MNRGRRVIVREPCAVDSPESVTLGDLVYVNRDVHFEGRGRITVGALAMVGPGVKLLTSTHPMEAERRVIRGVGRTTSRAVTIGAHVWLCAGVIVLPGVTIGDRTVVGAGAVVTRDLPPDVFAAGNPARVIRTLNA